MPDNQSRRKSSVRSGVVSAKSLRTLLGLQPLDAALGDAKPVVQSVLPTLPEFDDLRRDQVPTPVLRHRNLVAVGELLSYLSQLFQQRCTRRNRLRLMRRPRPEL